MFLDVSYWEWWRVSSCLRCHSSVMHTAPHVFRSNITSLFLVVENTFNALLFFLFEKKILSLVFPCLTILPAKLSLACSGPRISDCKSKMWKNDVFKSNTEQIWASCLYIPEIPFTWNNHLIIITIIIFKGMCFCNLNKIAKLLSYKMKNRAKCWVWITTRSVVFEIIYALEERRTQ